MASPFRNSSRAGNFVAGVCRCVWGVAIACGAVSAFGQATWTGGAASNSNWGTGGNWSGGVPTSTTTATFNASTTRDPNMNSAGAVGRIVFATGTDAEAFTGSSTLTIHGVSAVGIDN